MLYVKTATKAAAAASTTTAAKFYYQVFDSVVANVLRLSASLIIIWT